MLYACRVAVEFVEPLFNAFGPVKQVIKLNMLDFYSKPVIIILICMLYGNALALLWACISSYSMSLNKT